MYYVYGDIVPSLNGASEEVIFALLDLAKEYKINGIAPQLTKESLSKNCAKKIAEMFPVKKHFFFLFRTFRTQAGQLSILTYFPYIRQNH
jgi:hypothetical protein